MKRFRFRLARLERLRGHAEKIARRQLGLHLSAVARIESDLAMVEQNIETCRATGDRGRALGDALEAGLCATRGRLLTRRESALVDAEVSRAVYTERRRELQILRNLHQRRREAWRDQTARAEQAELDDLARLRFAAECER